VLFAAGIFYWRNLSIRIAFLTFVLLELLSLGGQPIGPYPGAGLPWHYLQNLPMLSSTLPDRLSILADGAAAAVLALALDQFRARRAAPERKTWQTPAFAGMVIAVIALLPLFPVPYTPATVGQAPRGYVGAIDGLHLPANARMLIVPVPSGSSTWPMRWYAEKAVPKVMIGGDFIDASVKGHQSRSGRAGAGGSPLGLYLDALWRNKPSSEPEPTPAQIRAQMKAWMPAGIVADASPTTLLGQFLIQTFGQPTLQDGKFMAWKTSASGM
jgi:hypothetical protein